MASSSLRLASVALAALAALASASAPQTVTISNVVPRTDDTGAIMDAHDGKIIGPFTSGPLQGLYAWYAASYGLCKEPAGGTGCSGAAPGACGFQLNHNVSLWTSSNLKDWTSHGVVFQASTAGVPGAILFCPKVLFNAATQTWVMWVNMVIGASFSVSYYAAATSATPFGPFTIVKNVTTLAYLDTGDFNLFQDDDGTAYVIYTSHITGSGQTHLMSVEQLTPDYTATLGAAGNSGYFGQQFVEAPAMFKRGDTYWAVFGACCCYCKSGSPVSAYTAAHPLGPWTAQAGGPIDAPVSGGLLLRGGGGSAVCKGGCPSERRGRAAAYVQAMLGGAGGDDFAPSSSSSSVSVSSLDSGIHAQQTDVASYLDASGKKQYIWIGDMWQSAPDGIKGHDFTYWGPLTFDDTAGTVGHITFVSNFTITVGQ